MIPPKRASRGSVQQAIAKPNTRRKGAASQTDQLRAQILCLRAEIESRKKENKSLRTECGSLQTENASLSAKLKNRDFEKLKARVEALEKAGSPNSPNSSGIINTCSSADQGDSTAFWLDYVVKDVKSLNERLDDQEGRNNGLTKKLEDLEAQFGPLCNRVLTTETQMASLEENVRSLLETLVPKFLELEAQYLDTSERSANSSNKLAELSSSVVRLTKDATSWNDVLCKFKAMVHALTKRLEFLERTVPVNLNGLNFQMQQMFQNLDKRTTDVTNAGIEVLKREIAKSQNYSSMIGNAQS
jgi:chromosome segregation ATPase